MDNPEKLATYGKQDEENQSKNTNTNNINKTSALLQIKGGKDEPNKHK